MMYNVFIHLIAEFYLKSYTHGNLVCVVHAVFLNFCSGILLINMHLLIYSYLIAH